MGEALPAETVGLDDGITLGNPLDGLAEAATDEEGEGAPDGPSDGAALVHNDVGDMVGPHDGNTLGTVASFAQPKLLALILDSTGATKETTASGAWWLVLGTVGFVNLSAAAFYATASTVTPIEKLVTKQKAQ